MLDVIMRFIPNKVKTQIKDRVVDILSEASPDDRWRKLIRSFRSDAAFLSAFDAALERAVKRFVAEYEDKELVEALTQSTRFWDLPIVQKALKEVITRPASYLADERDTLLDTFAEVVPNEPPERVEQAVRFFLHCLAEEVINIPQLFPLYQVQLQKASLEQAREMVAVLRELQTDQRQTMTALLETVTQNQLLLPSANQATVPVAPKIYNNLPRPDYSDFVGREPEKKKVITLLSPKKREWVITIDGVGGVGKSALALEVAYHFLNKATALPKDEQFEAIIWTSAKQTVLTADGIRNRPQVLRTLEDIFTVISTTLKREDIIRARAEEQTTLALEALAERRTLLIIDNLETVDDERLLDFLRELPNPTKAIVTTRHRIDVASPVRLVGMSELEALALIGHLSQEKEVIISEEEAQRLYNRTGGLPLAIVLSISLVSFGHSVDSVLARLGSAKSDIIKFCFQSSLDAIKGQDAHKLLLALSLFAKDASREALGYVVGFGEDEISRDDGLVYLERLSLVNKTGNRFSMLPLTKIFANAEIEKNNELKDDLLERWFSFFMQYNSEAMYFPAANTLEIEIPNMIDFMERCLSEKFFFELATFLLLNNDLFRARGYWFDLNYYLNAAYNSLDGLPVTEVNKEVKAKLAYEIGYNKYHQGDLEGAKRFFFEVLNFFESKNNLKYVRNALKFLAEIYVDTGDKHKGRLYLEKSYQARKPLGPSASWHQIPVEIKLGGYERAFNLLKEIIQWTSSEDEENTSMTRAHGLLGQVEIYRGNHTIAQIELEHALRIVKITQIKDDLAFVMQNFALLHLVMSNHSEAFNYAQQALSLYKELGLTPKVTEMQKMIAQIQNL